jgi:hypothetical protein
MTRHTEKAHALARSGAALGSHAVIDEGAHAEGVYHGVCRGYKTQHEREYLREHARLVELRARRDLMLLGRLEPDPELIRHLEAFEAYMESLTEVKWDSLAHNTVMTVGKNLALDTFLAGSSYTVTGPYMGLIGAVSYSAISAADTMASHAGWTEGGTTNAPTYTGPRKTISWSAASAGSKAPSSAPVYAITGTGTVKGVFLVFGSGASASIDNTGGTLWSAGLFSGGDQAVVNTNTVTVTYSTSL